MCFMPYLSQVLHRTADQVKLYKAENADITKLIYIPAERKLEITFTPEENAQIILESSLKPQDKTLAVKGNKIVVPIRKQGRQTVAIKFEK